MLDVGLPSCRSSPSTYIWPARQKGMPNTHIWSCSKLQSHQKCPTLTFTSMIGTINYHLWNGSTLISDLLVRMASHPPRLEPPPPQWWKNSVLFTQAGATSATMMEDSHPDKNTSYHSDERFQHLHLTYSSERHIHPERNTSYHSDGRFSHFHLDRNTSYHNDERLPSIHEHILS